MADSSRPGKISQMRSYIRFAVVMNIQPLNPSEGFLIQYICFLARTLPLSSIRGYVDAIRILHNFCGKVFNWSVFACPQLHMVLAGIGKKGIPEKGHKKAAFGTHELLSLKRFCFTSEKGSKQRAAWAAIIICFWGCIRSNNVVPKSEQLFDPQRQICMANLQKIPEGFVALLTKTKTRSATREKLRVLLPLLSHLTDLCPVRAINGLLASVPVSLVGPLFVFVEDGSVHTLLYRDVRSVISTWASSVGLDVTTFGTHSARSGGATAAHHAGVEDSGIMKLGDWLSNTFLSYIKLDVSDLWSIQMKILHELSQAIL